MTDPTPIQSDAAAPQPADSPDRAGRVIDVPFPQDLTSIGTIVILTIFCMILAVISAVVILNVVSPRPLALIVLCFALAAQACIVMAMVLSTARRKQRRTVETLKNLAELSLAEKITRILPGARVMAPKKLMKLAVEQLARDKPWGVAVRIGPKDKLSPLTPIPFRFEARRLDELSDLDGMNPDELDQAADLPAPKDSPRGVRRNLILKGGLIFFSIFLLNWLARVIQSIAERRFRPELIFWTLALLAFMLVPADQSWLSNRQFLALPGGLLMRKSGWFKKTWRLKVFQRTTSFVMLYRLWRKQWIMVVSDGEQCESIMGLKPELELALRAWLAPHEPPSPEQLSDLT